MCPVAGLFEFRAMRDPGMLSPVPRGAARRPAGRAERGGLLGHLAAPRPASKLRVRQPRRLPKGLDADQATALLDSFRSWRDKAIAGLMLLSGLRSAEVLALKISDIDIPRSWALVTGKGDKERRVPVDAEVAGLIQTYLLLERPDSDADGTATSRLFVVAKGPNRDARSPPRGCGPVPVSPGTLRRGGRAPARPAAFLRDRAGRGRHRPGGHPDPDGHDHVDSSARYIHLAPAHVRAAFDDARARQCRQG